MKDFKEIKELFDNRTITREGTKFYEKQLFNNGKAYIYGVGYDDEKIRFYEVFKRKVVADIKHENGKIVRLEDKGHVAYPCNEDFGKWARNCPTFEQAMQYALKWSENAGT